MKSEKAIRVDQVQGGDEIRFEHQRKHRKAYAAFLVVLIYADFNAGKF